MQNTQVRIGQAVVSCIAINDRRNELEFTWVQQGRGFEVLVGQAIEYGAFQRRSRIRLGDKTKGDRQAVTFDPTYKEEEMKDSKEYAILIKWNPESSNQDPEILGFDSKQAFDNVVAQLEARKNVFVHSEHRADPAPKKNFKFEVLEKVEDPNTYRVTTMNRTKAGTLKDIVKALAEEIEADPTEMLLLGRWFKKGADNRYVKCDIPEIPAPPQFLLDAFERMHNKKGGITR